MAGVAAGSIVLGEPQADYVVEAEFTQELIYTHTTIFYTVIEMAENYPNE